MQERTWGYRIAHGYRMANRVIGLGRGRSTKHARGRAEGSSKGERFATREGEDSEVHNSETYPEHTPYDTPKIH